MKKSTQGNNPHEAFSELEKSVYAALETYSNVHRGSGLNSLVTTHLFEKARDIILDYLGMHKGKYVVIFCTPRRAAILEKELKPGDYRMVSSRDLGLPIGICALAARKNALPGGSPFQTGGGTTKLISKEWVIWANAPDRYEAGTPAIINTIAFAKALQLTKLYGDDIFKALSTEKHSADEILYRDELEKYSGQELLDELRKTHIGRDVSVPTREGIRPFINLDNSASTPTFMPVWNAFRQTIRQPEDIQQGIVHEARAICGRVLGAAPERYDVFFISNTTEAINLVAESTGREAQEGIEPVVVNTMLEHSSNDLPWRMLPDHTLIRLPIDTDGFVDLNELETLLSSYNLRNEQGKKRIRLVAISGASNVLGVCNDIKEISRIVHRYGARILVDAAQLVAHSKIDAEVSGIDYLAFSAHKVYAPFGCGVLLARKGSLNFSSGEMEQIYSSGEENVGGIAALGKALVILERIGLDRVKEEEQALTARALRGMAKIPGLQIYGIQDPEQPEFQHKLGVIVFIMKKMMANRVAKELATQGGIGVRYGCHCAHVLVKHILGVSPSLEKFQRVMQSLLPSMQLPGVTRVSLGIENTAEDVDSLIRVLESISEQGNHTPSKDKETSLLSHAEVQKKTSDIVNSMASRVYSQG